MLVTRAPGPLSDRAPNYCEDFGWKLHEPVVETPHLLDHEHVIGQEPNHVRVISGEAVFTIVRKSRLIAIRSQMGRPTE